MRLMRLAVAAAFVLSGCKPPPAVEVWDDDERSYAVSDSLIAEVACCGKVLRFDVPRGTNELCAVNYSGHSFILWPVYSRPDLVPSPTTCFAQFDRVIRAPVHGRVIVAFEIKGVTQ